MFCSNCSSKTNPGEMFCKQCGTRLNNEEQPEQLNVQQVETQQEVNAQYSTTNSIIQNDIDKKINPNMKKWAILSIIVPSIAIIWYIFIGLSFYIAIALAATGFGFAKKAEIAEKRLATIGKVLNGILVCFAIVMFFLLLVSAV